MKKWWIIAIVCMVMLSGCALQADTTPSPWTDIDQYPGVTMTTEQAKFPRGTDLITLSINNASGGEINYFEPFTLEIREGTQWQVVPFTEEVSFIEIAYMLQDSEVGSSTISLSYFGDSLKLGTYRIIKQINDGYVAAQFELIK